MEPEAVSRALAATVSVASGAGLTVNDAIVIQNSNRLAVWLVPCDVLARVAAPVRRNHEVAAFELEMARGLERADSLVGGLDSRVEPIVHVRDGFAVTYWKYYEPLPSGDITPDEYAQALEGLHAEMRQVAVGAPHFTDRVDEAHAIVRDRSRSPELADADRELLTNTLRSLQRAVVDRCATEQLLHGEPHAGNLLKTANGMRFIDLETCCYGPVEFDIAHTPIEVGRRYASADRLQLRDCRILMLAMIAAWRADRDDEFSNGREKREVLIREIRNALDHHGIDVRP
ncbi:MAG: aminoglycoside phosphotransferase family protein [Acidimicrobiales bacterium]|nr:MAG: aminoglycoside phosphotransferase family protein [Acidimicrobiales bacterium]